MKHAITRTVFGIFFLATLFMGLARVMQAQGDNGCSTFTAAGEWGITLTGTLILPTGAVPGAAVARLTLDAAGSLSGTEARNVGGGFANETITGTWTVNSDCTGTTTVKIFESGVLVRTSVLSLVFVDNLRELRGVQQTLVVPGGTSIPVVITINGKKLFPGRGN
jgi:hypothetical protein